MLTVLLAATAIVPQLPEAQVPAAPAAAVAPAIPVLDPQMPVGQVHSSGVTLERTMTGARIAELPELSAASMAMVAFTPDHPVQTRVAAFAPAPTALKGLPIVPSRQLPLVAKSFVPGGTMARDASGSFAHALTPTPAYVKVSLSGDSSRAAFAEGSKLLVADTVSGALIKEFDLGSPIKDVILSADGRRAALHLRDDRKGHNYTSVLEIESGELMERRTDLVSGMALSPSGQVLAHVGPNGTVHLWDNEREILKVHEARLNAGMGAVSDFSKDGAKLAVGAHGGVYLLDLKNGTRDYLVFHDRYATTHQIALSEDGRSIAAADDDGFVHVWNLDAKTHATFPTMASSLDGLAFDGDALVWLDKLGRYGRARPGKNGIMDLEFSKAQDPEQLWTAAMNADVAIEGRARPGARVRVVRLKASKAKAAAVTAPRTEEPAFVPPKKTDELGAAYADVMARFEIARAEDVVPRLARWLTADLEIFRLAARKNLLRLAALGDERARVIMEAWSSRAARSGEATSPSATPAKAKTSPLR